MLLYLAGPLFNANEVAFNARLTAAIEALGYDVFLPQRDGYELGSNPETGGSHPSQAWPETDRLLNPGAPSWWHRVQRHADRRPR